MPNKYWFDGIEVSDLNSDIFHNYYDADTTPWVECKIGFFPKRCALSNKLIWPYTKASKRTLIHITNKRLFSKTFWACTKEAIFANLKINY